MGALNKIFVSADLRGIMPRFWEIRLEELGELKRVLAAGDMEGIAFLGHRLKGSGGSYGFDRLTDLGAELESAAKVADLDTAARIVSELSDYMDNLEIIYEDSE